MQLRWILCSALLFASTGAFSQEWSQAYDKALTEARAGNWTEARAAFKQAAAYRTEDFSGPTNLPGPATERRQWRSGAPYSPNFLSAYSAYRAGVAMTGGARTEQLRTAASELEALHSKGQLSAESFYYLHAIYVALGDTERRLKLDERFGANAGKINFRVDTEPLSPEEVSAINQMMNQASAPVTQPPITTPPGTGTNPTTTPVTVPTITPGAGVPVGLGTRVPAIGSKFALVIGNSASRMEGQTVSFSSEDAQRVREALAMSAGYPEENIDLVLNATASQMLASARAMAERIPNDATVFVYFSGAGVNLDGKDFLAGVDSESPTDSSSMASKGELLKFFTDKGAKVFSFFQVHRTMNSPGRYFGMEIPLFGRLAQAQATMPGDQVHSFVRDGRTVGLYTDALVATLNEFRSNQVPILEFGWQLFYRMRRGGTGSDGGGSRQTPTLPVVTNIASNAVF